MSNGSGNVSKEKVQRAAKHQRWDEGAQAEFEKDATVQCLQPAILMKGSDRSATYSARMYKESYNSSESNIKATYCMYVRMQRISIHGRTCIHARMYCTYFTSRRHWDNPAGQQL